MRIVPKYAQALAWNVPKSKPRSPDKSGPSPVPFYVRSLSPMLARPDRRHVLKPVLSRGLNHAPNHGLSPGLKNRNLAVAEEIAADDRVLQAKYQQVQAEEDVPNHPQVLAKRAGARGVIAIKFCRFAK
jgi:hypothetical protein